MFFRKPLLQPEHIPVDARLFNIDITEQHDHETQLKSLRLNNKFYGSLKTLSDPVTSLCIRGETLFGYAIADHTEQVQSYEQSLWIYELCVREQNRGQRLGAVLLQHVVSTAYTMRPFESVALISRRQAENFYERLGFEPLSPAKNPTIAITTDQLQRNLSVITEGLVLAK